ncbi:MAG: ABC transporter ATP-binding protein [bacterium]|nr:ABC transporter ATP-binding protein [bacterium]
MLDLAIKGVEKSFGDRRVLRGLDLSIPAGKITALLARNGAGKSTLVSVIAGRLRPDAGEVLFQGQPIATAGSIRRDRELIGRIGVAPQETGVYPDASAIENLTFAGGCYGLRGRVLGAAATRTLALLGLTSLADTKARLLSGGQKRRLHTAMALVHEPDLILLDEATVGSDPEARRYILDAVRGLAAKGATVLYTSHYFPEIEALQADIAILRDGRIIRHGSFEEIVGGDPQANLEEIYFAAHAAQVEAQAALA